jgi:hypothetical protein
MTFAIKSFLHQIQQNVHTIFGQMVQPIGFDYEWHFTKEASWNYHCEMH